MSPSKKLTDEQRLELFKLELLHAQGAVAECTGMRQALDNRLVDLNKRIKYLTKAIKRAGGGAPKIVIAKDLPPNMRTP